MFIISTTIISIIGALIFGLLVNNTIGYIICCFFLSILSLLILHAAYKPFIPQRFFGKLKTYQIDLYSITPNIEVYNDMSKNYNISTAKREVVEKIMVQETMNNKYYREIVTGKLIPVSIKEYHKNSGTEAFKNFNSPVFVLCEHKFYNNQLNGYYTIQKNAEECSFEDVTRYISEKSGTYEGFESFKDYLNSLFTRAKDYYKNSKQKRLISDDKKIYNLLKQKI